MLFTDNGVSGQSLLAGFHHYRIEYDGKSPYTLEHTHGQILNHFQIGKALLAQNHNPLN